MLLVIPVLFLTNPAYAVSSGYERYKDDECEVYLEYFPIVPFDSYYPTASEEFAIKFHIWQNSWWVVPLLDVMFPRGFEIKVYYRCDSCGYSDYASWKTWYPTSTTQYGATVDWHLSEGYAPFTLSASVSGPDVFSFDRNYDEYDESYGGKTYLHVGDLAATYRSNFAWGPVDVYGAGSIGIQNGAAQGHQGHDVRIWVHVTLRWLEYDWWQYFDRYRHFNFVLGDDNPADTDCWLTVEEGTVAFGDDHHFLTISSGSGGTTQPPPSTRVYDYGESVKVTASADSYYDFDYWILDEATMYGNEITVTMNSDHTLKAYFEYSGGGGGGCPTLFVWDGEEYAEEGILDIHAESDVTVQHWIQNTLALDDGIYKLQLRELDEYTSHIDQVKLYAVDGEGEWCLCPLTYAYHNELGKVKHTLRFDDDNRVDLKPTEIIDLKFGQPIPYSETEYFIFEINGVNLKPPMCPY